MVDCGRRLLPTGEARPHTHFVTASPVCASTWDDGLISMRGLHRFNGVDDEKDCSMTLVPLRDERAATPLAASPTTAVPAWSRDWAGQGRCSDSDPDALFVQGKEQRLAKVVCRGCPVVAECLADALDNRTPFGVWGGMTERERRQLLRQRTDIDSWQSVLCGKNGT